MEEHIKVERRLDHDLNGFEMVQLPLPAPRLPTKCKFCNVNFLLKMQVILVGNIYALCCKGTFHRKFAMVK
jgi:hypothetical protein